MSEQTVDIMKVLKTSIELAKLEKTVEGELQVNNLVSKLKNFSYNQKMMLILKYAEGLNYEEISAIMQTPILNVRYTINKMLSKLKDAC